MGAFLPIFKIIPHWHSGWRQKMKRILFIFLSVFCISLLTACSEQTNETDNNQIKKMLHRMVIVKHPM